MGKKFDNLGKTENMGGLSTLIQDSTKEKPTPTADKDYIIKTFTIAEADFNYIKKYVKYRRMNGDTEFTQKEALGEAIKLLRGNTPDI
jgi:hypothetical protein